MLIICAISYTLYLKNALNNLNILSINTTNDYSNLANNVVEKYHCYKETNEKDKIIIDHQEIETRDEIVEILKKYNIKIINDSICIKGKITFYQNQI